MDVNDKEYKIVDSVGNTDLDMIGDRFYRLFIDGCYGKISG